MRAGVAAFLLLVLLLAPPSAAQPAQAARVEAEVSLGDPLGTILHVNLTARDATQVTLPGGAMVALAEGGRHAYTVELARDSERFVLVARDEVIPPEVGAAELRPPGGWAAVGSADVLVFARDLHVEAIPAGPSHVRLATPGAPSEEDVAFLARGTAYLAAHHPDAPREILVLRAPRDALARSYVANGTLVLAGDEDVADLARLMVRLHQRYRVVEVPPASAAWFREGEERLQIQMSLLAAGLRTTAEVDDTFLRARAVGEPDARLPQASAGTTLARQKGLVVVRALDVALRNASGGAASLADLVARMEASDARFDSAGIQEEAEALAGPALAAFFDDYVYGSEWPPTPGARDAADVFVRSLELRPARAGAGEQVVAAYEAVNLGTQPSDLDLVLRLDGVPIQTAPLRLDVGARGNGTLTLVADAAGTHVVHLGARNATLHVLSAPRLSLARASATPAEPRAGEPFTLLVYVENRGETPGRARVEVYENERLVQRTTEARIGGLATDALTLPLRADEPGLHAFEIRLEADRGANATLHHTVNVLQAETTRDAPWPGALLLLLVGGLALAARRR